MLSIADGAEPAPNAMRTSLASLKQCINAFFVLSPIVSIGLLQEFVFSDLCEALPITVLDEAYPDTPVVILDALGHGAVVNTEALRQVGLLDAGKVPGGEILRDTDGSPFGIVTENAQQFFRDAAFPPSPENQQIAYDSLLDAIKTLNSNGITSVSDAGGFWRQAQTESWERALQENQLTIRASNALYVYPDMDFEEQLPQLQLKYSNDKDSLLRFNQAKVYVDGILSLGTAALYEPYLDILGLPEEQSLGFEYFGSAMTLNNVTQQLVENGFQIHFHVVGDRAAGLALDAIESFADDTSGGPHRLTHCYLIDERDRERFAQLGVVADFQLAPSSLDPEYYDFLAFDIIGSTRADAIFPVREVYDTGALVTLSSDWDADDLSPISKIQTVLQNEFFTSVDEVIPLMTTNAAKLLQQDDKAGSLEVGKYADLVVLNKDIFELSVAEIEESRVVLTMFQGTFVYNSTKDDGDEDNSGAPDGFSLILCGLLVSLLTCSTLW